MRAQQKLSHSPVPILGDCESERNSNF